MKKVWFKRKLYGWGWFPVTWQGWLVTALYVWFIVHHFKKVDALSHSGSDTLIAMALPFILATTVLAFVCFMTGEKPKWQWGKREED